MPVYLLSDTHVFPPPTLARKDGLLAVGGDLEPDRLLLAYRMGIFPWYSNGDPILWWSPDPRLVLYPEEINVSRSLRRVIRKAVFRTTLDTAFERVIRECVKVRQEKDEGTWITPDMIAAYCRLHQAGFAHSVEAWCGSLLAGGLYGVSLGGCFFGESMFTRRTNASKVALVALAEQLNAASFRLIDCQVPSDHLIGLGARQVPRDIFLDQLKGALAAPTVKGKWVFQPKRG